MGSDFKGEIEHGISISFPPHGAFVFVPPAGGGGLGGQPGPGYLQRYHPRYSGRYQGRYKPTLRKQR